MPFSIADVDKHHEGLDAKKKRQWVQVANSALKRGESDATAIRMANGVVKGLAWGDLDIESPGPTSQKCYEDAYSLWWTPFGGATSFAELEEWEKAQETAHEIQEVSYQFRTLVDNILGDGSITDKAGRIKLLADEFQAKLGEAEMEMVDGEGGEDKSLGSSFLSRVTSAIKSVAGVMLADPWAPGTSMPAPVTVTKDANGQTRMTLIVSNKYRDHDGTPEILSESAHSDWARQAQKDIEVWTAAGRPQRTYVKAYKAGFAPVMQLWHTPGTEFADVDHVDVVDGFLIASGVVRPGYEDLAKSLGSDPTLGVSHGYYVTRRDTKDWTIVEGYRQFETSVLPLRHAANVLTGVLTLDLMGTKNLEGGDEMDAKKREFLVTRLGEAKVAELEGRIKDMGSVAAMLGLEAKDLVDGLGSGGTETPGAKSGTAVMDPPAPTTPTPDSAPPSDGAKSGPDTTTDTDALAVAVSQKVAEILGLKDLSDYLAGIKAKQAQIETTLAESQDAVLRKAWQAPAATGAFAWSRRPSEDPANVITKDTADQLVHRGNGQAPAASGTRDVHKEIHGLLMPILGTPNPGDVPD